MVATKQKLSIEFTNLSLLLFPSPIFLFFVPLLLLSNFIHTLHPKYCNITSMTSWEWHHHMTPSFKFHWSSLDQNTCTFFSCPMLQIITSDKILTTQYNMSRYIQPHQSTQPTYQRMLHPQAVHKQQCRSLMWNIIPPHPQPQPQPHPPTATGTHWCGTTSMSSSSLLRLQLYSWWQPLPQQE